MLRVGIEIHARIKTDTKLFSQASALVRDQVSGRPPVPNSQVAFLDCSLPGAMPRLNPACVKQAVLTGLAVNGSIQPVSVFERKHYFYCDQPLGFQITQQSLPIVRGGELRLPHSQVTVRLSRIQLEQDTGKSMHFGDFSLVDLNRAGCALMEIVSLPDMTSAAQAGEYVRTMQDLLQTIGTCDGQMEDGSLRADVNVSTSNNSPFRVEIKNLNSIRSVERAIAFEEARLLVTKLEGNETRSFDVKTGTTQPLRDKESAIDYRFMVEPDLPPLHVPAELVLECQASMNELPSHRRLRLETQFPDLKPQDVDLFLSNPTLLRYFEQVVAGDQQPLTPKQVANLVNNTLLGAMRKERQEEDPFRCVPPQEFQRFLRKADQATSVQVKEWVSAMVRQEPWGEAVDNDGVDIAGVVRQAMASNPAQLAKYRAGKTVLAKFFFGQAMIQLKAHNVDVERVRQVVDEVLKE